MRILVFVLATLRSDFYSQIQQPPAFVDLKEADGQFDLLPAGRTTLMRIAKAGFPAASVSSCNRDILSGQSPIHRQ
jgi:hypothetical protein